MWTSVRETVTTLTWAVLAYAAWTVVHCLAAHAYAMHCTPMSWPSIMFTPVRCASPECVVLRNVVDLGANAIFAFWAAVLARITRVRTTG